MPDQSDCSEQLNPNYQIEIIEDRNVAVVTCSGTLSMSLFLAFHEEFLAHPAFRANLDRLYDFRAAELDFQSDEIRTIYQILQGNDAVHGYRKVVFLVAEDIQFGMLRMFSSIADPLHADFAVMRDRTEANIWLGLPSDF